MRRLTSVRAGIRRVRKFYKAGEALTVVHLQRCPF